ncbi:HGxxPAAW family protein [Nonomuraea typhae]|uniref:HGxxPAAW family protein n=1 Tax=Nonomuraea typhae TaxID=2603600 RepID=A0ABW7Z4E5_9ACTN|nr:HGxxPAAW family protein [Nonomuraea typhae]
MSGGENLGNHAGRPSSWLAVAVAFAGFVVAGFGMPLESWLMIWIGIGLVVVGAVLALVFDIMSDVVIDAPRVGMRAEKHR